MSLETIEIFILVAGLLLLFIGIFPIISNRHFEGMNEKVWRSDSKLLTDRDKYIYNRYITQILPIGLGLLLTAYSLWELFGR